MPPLPGFPGYDTSSRQTTSGSPNGGPNTAPGEILESDAQVSQSEASLERVARFSTRQQAAVLSVIDANLSGALSVNDLARSVGYSERHFWRTFKNTFDVSPYQFILTRRTELAKRLLKDANMRISAIALACGFADQGHFTRTFKQRTGLTPRKFRKLGTEPSQSDRHPRRR